MPCVVSLNSGVQKPLRILMVLLLSGVMARGAEVTIEGIIKITPGGRPAAGVSIINQASGFAGVSGADGKFKLKVPKEAQLFLFYPGYQTVAFSVADSADADLYRLELQMGMLSTGSSQAVVIKPKKTLEDIEDQRKKLGEIPKELEQPEMSFTSPISALYELLSDRARERSKLRAQMLEDNRRRIFKELFDYYREQQLFDLPEEYDDRFIDFCNLSVDFLKYNSDYIITKTILDQYKKYALQTGLRK